MLDKLERKLGRYAIPKLMNWVVAGYVLGYIFYAIQRLTGAGIISLMTLEPYYICHGQIWRIITWVMIPPEQNLFFAIIMIIFYWQLGNALERVWGTFRFNAYMFGGLIFTIIGAFALYIVSGLVSGHWNFIGLGNYFSTNYINLSIFLAFAMTFPEERVLLYFFIPVKMKWMALLYVIFLGIDIINALSAGTAGIPMIVAIAASLLNFVIYYLQSRNWRGPRQMKRQHDFRRSYRHPSWKSYTGGQRRERDAHAKQVPMHKCCICGRTELSNPELDFRFCTKCKGNYEYCSDHLYTHVHKV